MTATIATIQGRAVGEGYPLRDVFGLKSWGVASFNRGNTGVPMCTSPCEVHWCCTAAAALLLLLLLYCAAGAFEARGSNGGWESSSSLC